MEKRYRIISKKNNYFDIVNSSVTFLEPHQKYLLKSLEFSNDVNIADTENHMQDGKSYINSSLNIKNITLVFTILGDTTQELKELKRRLLQATNPKEKQFKLIDLIENKAIECVVDSIPEFEKLNETTELCKMDLTAHNPYWQDTEDIKEDIVSWTNLFEFPIEVPVEGLEFATRNQDLIVNVINSGDVSTGMIIVFKANASVVNPSLTDINTQKFIKLKYTMAAGEEIRINRNFNNKRIDSTLNKVTTNVFKNLDWESTFLQLDVGDNLFRYNAESGLTNLDVSIYYNNSYLGV